MSTSVTTKAKVEFVMAEANSKFIRFTSREAVPEGVNPISKEDLEALPLAELCAIYSRVAMVPTKNFKSSRVAVDSIIFQMEKKIPVSSIDELAMPLLTSVGEISKGERNTHLSSLAGTMRQRGAAPSAITTALLEENSLRCNPPLPEEEVLKIDAYASSKKYARKSPNVYEVVTPKSEKVLQDLAPQARELVLILIDLATEKGSATFSQSDLDAALAKPEVTTRLRTRQPPSRIFQYYKASLQSAGVLRVS